MSKIIISDSALFENKIEQFETSLSKLKDIFHNEKMNTEKINGTDIWNSPVQKTIYEKLIDLQKNYSPIEESIQLYINFLKKTLDDYNRLEAKVNENLEKNDTEMNVNS